MSSQKWDPSCQWPRRLLHVKTMTSYEWKANNTYGNVRNPKYNAMSYTWGRWKLEPTQKPGIKAIDIKGISWAVPRVDPAHFSVEQFSQAMTAATAGHKIREDTKGIMNNSDFLWVDIACIDQTDGSLEMAEEVGRQGKIFKGADTVYVWLNGINFSTLNALDEQLRRNSITGILGKLPYETRKAKSGGGGKVKSRGNGKGKLGRGLKALLRRLRPGASSKAPEKLEKDEEYQLPTSWNTEISAFLGALSNVGKDPWFSSLWTLQEAYLRQDCILLAEGTSSSFVPTCKISEITVQLLNLNQLFSESSWRNATNTTQTSLPEDIFRLGLYDFTYMAPMSIVSSAQFRQSKREPDRIIGIMQVFDLQLGSSNPKANPNQKFTLPQLQDELGEALITKWPILSQMFVHSRPAPVGKAWRCVGALKVPELGPYMIEQQKDIEMYSSLGTRQVNGDTWGKFSGRTMLFKDWYRMPFDDSLERHVWLDEVDKSRFGSVPKNFPSASSMATSQSSSSLGGIDKKIGEQAAEWLISKRQDTIILPLGHYSFSGKPEGVVALLLIPSANVAGTKTWYRIGICLWEIRGIPLFQTKVQDGGMAISRNESSGDWVYNEGIYG